jgi:hypothetical protein
MTFLSSFLIRCRLNPEPGSEPANVYSIHHVQTGDEFRSSSLSETTEWMATLNRRYLGRCISESAQQNSDGIEEDRNGGK